MRENNKQYVLEVSADKITRIIREELNRNVFYKRYNLSAKSSENVGLNIYSTLSYFYFTPNLGPLVKLNLNSTNLNKIETESKLVLKRVNGATFKMHFWMSIIFIIVGIVASIYLIFKNGTESIEALILPLFGIIYLIFLELLAGYKISSLTKTVEKIMKIENIEHKKL